MSMKRVGWQKAGKLLGFLVFLALAFFLYSGLTGLFRNADSERERVLALDREGDLDMVYVGSSSAQLFWHPLMAWNDRGFTSYCLSTNGLKAEAVQSYMELAMAHHPKVLVVDVRPFQFYTELDKEGYLRNSSDSMSLLNPERYRLLNDYLRGQQEDAGTDVLSYYFDLAKYHTRTEQLENEKAWRLARGEAESPARGAAWHTEGVYAYHETPEGFLTQEKGGMDANCERILNQLLAWCRGRQVPVLFVVCPYTITPDQQRVYNQIKSMVEEAGFDFLNANEHYQEIGIDFRTDFFDTRHVNILGARKYTAWLGKLLQTRYGLPDHRGEEGFDRWTEDYRRFVPVEAEAAAQVKEKVQDALHGQFTVREMKQTSSFEEWSHLATDDRFILLICGKRGFTWPSGGIARARLHDWGLSGKEAYFIRVIQNGEILYYNEHLHDREKKGFLSWLSYQIGLDAEDRPYLELEGERFALPEEGISVTVLDTNFRKAVAQFLIESDGGGALVVRDRTEEIGAIRPDYGFRGTALDLSDADRLELIGAEITEDGWLGQAGVLCTGCLPLEPGLPWEELSSYLMDQDFVGFGLPVEDPSPYRFLCFYGRKVADGGEPTVFAFTDAGKIVAEVSESHKALDNEWHLYTMDLSGADEWIYVIFNGGCADYTGGEESQFIFSDVELY